MLHAQDILDQRVIENGGFVAEYTQNSLTETIFQIVNMVQQSQNQLEIDYIYTKRHKLIFDKRRLQQVLLNLLSNATKFQSSGTIRVFTALQSKGSDDLIEVTVKDQGLGMTEEETQQLFCPSSPAQENRQKTAQSNGIGLSICKKICEELKGGIKVHSVKGKGSTFTFSMKVFQT